MNKNEFNNILNECLDRILQGDTVEQCLRSHPEQASELEPLLRTAVAAKVISDIKPRPEFKARARLEFQSTLQKMESQKTARTGFLHWHWRWQWQSGWAIAIVAIVIVVMAGGSTVAAAGNSMPDSTLYPVKLTTEHVQMAFTFSDIGKAELNAKQADTRVEEMVYLASKGDTQEVQAVAQRLNNNLKNLSGLAEEKGRTEAISTQQSQNLAPPPTAESEQQPRVAAGASGQSSAGTAAVAPAAVPSPMTPLAQAGSQPAVQDLYSPIAGAAGVSTKPVFSWSVVAGATSYDLRVADNPIFVNPIDSQTGLKATTWTETNALEPGKTYYWGVRAISASGMASDWVNATFTTAAVAEFSQSALPAPATLQKDNNLASQAARSNVDSSSAKSGVSSTSNAGGKDQEREKLKEIIIKNAESSRAKLNEALSKASPNVRPALRQALAQSESEYNKAIKSLEQSANEN